MRNDLGWLRQWIAGALFGMVVMAAVPGIAAQVGDALSLGKVNRIDAQTELKGNAAGANLQVTNIGASPAISATAKKAAISIQVDRRRPPLKVNPSAGTATNLSADKLDGLDSTAFLQPSGLAAAHSGGDVYIPLGTDDQIVKAVALTAPADGVVIVTSTTVATVSVTAGLIACSLTTGASRDNASQQVWQSGGDEKGDLAQLAGTRGFDVTANQALTVNLVCASSTIIGSPAVVDPTLTAIFIPSP